MGRSFKANDQLYIDFLQTDAAINPAPAARSEPADGEVIGINTAIFSGAQGIGYHPGGQGQAHRPELKSFGKVRPAWVGINAMDLTAPVARKLGWEHSDGVVVDSVDQGSPAAKAGVRPGDVVAELGGSPVQDTDEFQARLRGYPARAAMPLLLFRDGQSVQVTVTPIEFPSEQADAFAWDRLGLRLAPSQGTRPCPRSEGEPGGGLRHRPGTSSSVSTTSRWTRWRRSGGADLRRMRGRCWSWSDVRVATTSSRSGRKGRRDPDPEVGLPVKAGGMHPVDFRCRASA
jgi:hypothetical protein